MFGIMNRKKTFVEQVMYKARQAHKAKAGSLASCIMTAFLPELTDTPPIVKPSEPMKRKFQPGDGTIGLTNRHGVIGAAIFMMKRNRMLVKIAKEKADANT